MSDWAQLQTEPAINAQRQLLAGPSLAAQNLGSMAFRNPQFLLEFDGPDGFFSINHAGKFGYFEPPVKGKVRLWGNDAARPRSHSSGMGKHRKHKSGDPGWYVREWLAFKGLNQKDLVARTDWNKSQVSEWVTGAERWNRDVLHAFAYAIGVEPADLLRPPPLDPVDDEFSRFAAGLDHAQKRRLLRLWEAASGDLGKGAKVA